MFQKLCNNWIINRDRWYKIYQQHWWPFRVQIETIGATVGLCPAPAPAPVALTDGRTELETGFIGDLVLTFTAMPSVVCNMSCSHGHGKCTFVPQITLGDLYIIQWRNSNCSTSVTKSDKLWFSQGCES